MFGCIYLITNNITKMRYIGQTTRSLEKRFKEHFAMANCNYLYSAMHKYGLESFSYKVLARANTIEELNNRETYYIKIFNTLAPNGYNLSSGGKNAKPSKMALANMKKAKKGVYKGSSNPFFGKHHSAATKLKISRNHGTKRAIKNNETNVTYSSITEAAKLLNLSYYDIYDVLRKRRSTKNWSYLWE